MCLCRIFVDGDCRISAHCKLLRAVIPFNVHFLLALRYYQIMIGCSVPAVVLLPSAAFLEDSVKRHLKPCSAFVCVLYKVQSDGDHSENL